MSDMHILVVSSGGEDIDVEHPDDCAYEDIPMGMGADPTMTYREWACAVGWQLSQIGYDQLKEEFDQWPPPDSRYPIEAWHEEIVIPMVGTEHDAGLRLIPLAV